jgi:hypothetical protein
VIATPQDKELAELSIKIGDTLIGYGNESRRNSVAAKQSSADSAVGGAKGLGGAMAPATSAVAERAAYNFKSGKAVQGEGELIDALKEGKVKLETVEKSELPEELRKLSPEELKEHIAKKQAEREAIQKQIAELSKQRDAYLTVERAKQAKDKKADSFDTEVAKSLRAQAKKKGIRYE